MPVSSHRDVDSALEQLAYTADEVEALEPLLRRVPLAFLNTVVGTPESPFSIVGAFVAIRTRDRRLAEMASAGQVPSSEDCLPVRAPPEKEWNDGDSTAALKEIAKSRRQLVEDLRRLLGRADDTVALVARLFDIIHADAEILREVAYTLHSGPVTGQLQADRS